MKLRNRLIALVCLIFFLFIGAGLFLSTTNRKPFAIILFTADNISPSNLGAARLFSGGGDARLNIEDFPFTAMARNAANDFSVPDTASASTEIMAGERVNRGSLCISPAGAPLSSLLEDASTKGRATGIITTGIITGPGAAASYAKVQSSTDVKAIKGQFFAHPPFDLVAGGGFDELINTQNTNTQSTNGYAVIRSVPELEKQPFWKKVPLLLSLTPASLSQDEFTEGNLGAPSLSDIVRIAIRNLQSNSKGYLLVVDDPLIGSAAGSNDAELMFRRLIAFDRAVSTARRYAGSNALIVVTGRENIGGLNLNGYPFLRDKGVSVLAMNNEGYPTVCWSTGPGYAIEKSAKEKNSNSPKDNSSVGILTQPSGFRLTNAVGTAGDVLSAGSGPGAENIHGFIDLKQIHRILSEAL
jgi:alkaline phosphatase